MWQVQVMLFGTFWNFFLNIFHLQLVETLDTEPQIWRADSVCVCVCVYSDQLFELGAHTFE